MKQWALLLQDATYQALFVFLSWGKHDTCLRNQLKVSALKYHPPTDFESRFSSGWKGRAARWVLVGLLVLAGGVGWNVAQAAQETAQLTSITAVRRLQEEEARRHFTARFDAVVTYCNPWRLQLYIQQSDEGLFVTLPEGSPNLEIGQKIRLDAFTQMGLYAPILIEPKWEILEDSATLRSTQVSYHELITGRYDARRVEVEGVVQASYEDRGRACMALALPGGVAQVVVPKDLRGWEDGSNVDAKVRIRAVCAAVSNSERQFVGFELLLGRHQDFEVLEPPPVSLEAVPQRMVSDLGGYRAESGMDHRVRVKGVVTHVRPEFQMIVQDESGGILVGFRKGDVVRPGDLVEVVGFPYHTATHPELRNAEYRIQGKVTEPSPRTLNFQQVQTARWDPGYSHRLVRIRGYLLGQHPNPVQGEHLLTLTDTDRSRLFSVRYQEGSPEAKKLEEYAPGSLMEITGVAHFIPSGQSEVGLEIWMRGAGDLLVLERPPWWMYRYTVQLVLVLVVVSMGGVAWAALLRRQVRTQTHVIREQLGREALLEEQFIELFDNANDIMYTHDLQGRMSSMNPAGEKIIGYESKVALTMNFRDFLMPGQETSFQEAIERTTSGYVSVVQEFEIRSKSGERLYLEVSLRPRYEGEVAVGVQGIARDITQRKRNEARKAVFSELSHRFSVASTREEAAIALSRAAYQLIGWDAFSLELYNEEKDCCLPVLRVETIGERKSELPLLNEPIPSNDYIRSILDSGGRLLHESTPWWNDFKEWTAAFSRRRKPTSALVMPLRHGVRSLGLFSVHSYEGEPYEHSDLEVLQALSDHCSNAFERISAEQSLRDSERRFRTLIESSTDVIAMMRTDGTVFYSTPSVFRILGYAAEVFEDKSFLDLLHPVDLKAFRYQMEELSLRREGTTSFTLRARHQDGDWRWLEGSATWLMSEPSIGAIVLNYRDVTSRRRAEEEVKASEARFRGVVESLGEGLVITDLTDVITQTNTRMEELTGYRQDEMINHRAHQLFVDPEDWPEVMLLNARRAEGQSEGYEMRLKRRDGTFFWAEINAAPFRNPDGQIIGTLGAITDITDRRNLESQLRQSQKMESIGQLAAGVAHDFNNIVTIIQGHASLLEKSHTLPQDLEGSVEHIIGAAERAANLTRQLLTFSRKQVMQPKVLDINEVITNLAKLLQRPLGADISLQLHLHEGATCVFADEGMVEQILTNLSVNARDAMVDGGCLRISTEVVQISEAEASVQPDARPGRFVRMRVSDTGTGMDDKVLARIFDPFFTTKEVGKGTGLGLSTVYGVVKQHQGWIHVFSKLGEGTTFEVYFPHREPLGGSQVKLEVDELRGGRETILIVEDEPALMLMVIEFLTDSGYRIIEAETGAEALTVFNERSHEIDLVLTDMVMPGGISGRELAKKIRSSGSRIPIIFSSGYSIDMVRKEINLDEGYGFLAKPYRPADLLRTVRKALDEFGDASTSDGHKTSKGA